MNMKTLSGLFCWRALLCAVLLLAAGSGCSSRWNGTLAEPLLGGDVDLVSLGDRVAQSLITQAMPPLAAQGDLPVLVTTVVNNDNLDDTSGFGRSFQNNIIAGFVWRGYGVRELKLRRDLLVELHRGEFMLSRDLDELRGVQQAQAVVVGTYALANRIMYLSIRLVSTQDHTILSAYEQRLCLDANTLGLLGLSIKNTGDDDELVRPPAPSRLDALLY